MSPLDLHLEVGDPLVRGGLALYPLFGDGAVAPDYVPGPLASAAATLRVSERETGPTVPELLVTNAGKLPVLLVEGENLLGGWQNRTLNVSVVVPAAATIAVPVSCVEQRRWGGRPDGARPAPALAPTALRARKQRTVSAGVLAGAVGRRADQGEVWRAVEEYTTRFAVTAPTAALDDVQRARDHDVTGMVGGTRPLPLQRGVAVAIGRQVRSVDLFDRATTLEAYWDSLVRGYALDAIGASGGTGVDGTTPPGRRAVVAAFDTLRRARTRRLPAVGLGDEVHAQGESLTAGALVWEGALVHLGMFLDGVSRAAPRRQWFS